MTDSKVTEFKNIINDAAVSDMVIEDLFDLMANTYNIFGCTVPTMTGTSGSKTVTYTSAEKGAVFQGARLVYASFFKNSSGTTSVGAGPLSYSTSSSLSSAMNSPGVWDMIKDIAVALKGEDAEYKQIAFRVGTGT
jgi:hypothetical protein